MSDMVMKIGIAMLMKLMTETFLARAFVHTAKALAAKSNNDLDDKIVDDIAKALDVV